MRRRASVLAALLLWAGLIAPAAAHDGAAQQNVGGITVRFDQDPLSPLVGETVVMIFTLTGESGQPVEGLEVTVSITDIAAGQRPDPIMTRTVATDDHGVLETPYAFAAASTYDIDLAFRRPGAATASETGFLVQVREGAPAIASPASKAASRNIFWIGLVAGLLLGWSVARRQSKKA